MDLEKKIEAVLFYKAEPMKKSALAEFLAVPIEEIERGLLALSARLMQGATRLTATDTSIQLVTAPEMSDVIDTLRKDDLKRDIGKAGAETLAIIIYRGPISRSDIDRIRGVNSTFILRNLLIRGLIERRDNPKDQRTLLYAATPSLFNHLGIGKREDLPQFVETMNALDAYEKETEVTAD